MDPIDTAWCPTCDRQIVPKRYDVPVTQPAPTSAPAPAPVVAPAPATRQKSNVGRPRGLVHGTGRARPALKRANSKQAPAPAPVVAAPAAEPTKPAAPVKTKSVIDQSPLPLYCSDDCRLLDLHKLDDGFSYNYNPERHTYPSATPLSTTCSADSEVDSPTTSDDTDSTSVSSEQSHTTGRSYQQMDKSIATLAAIYGFPAMPPAPPPRSETPPPRPVQRLEEEYNSGIMMAARRIKETLCPEASKRSKFASPSARYTSSLTRDRKAIPGWTDGSDAWRASVYSQSAPRDWTLVDPKNPENRSSAYTTCVAAAHRSAGVVSTLGEGPSAAVAAAVAARTQSQPSPDALQELYGNYPLFDTTRSDSRARLYPGTSQSLPSRPVSAGSERRTRECGILPKQAEGKLLVPNIKLRRNVSSASVSTIASNGPRSPRMLTRRGSAMSDDVIHEEDETATRPIPSSSLPITARTPTVRKPADEPFLYDCMIPMIKEKRVERRVVAGREQEVEVEVMVPKEVERLFLGPDGVNHLRERRKLREAEERRTAAKAARAAILASCS